MSIVEGAITKAMSWQPSENGPSYAETRQQVDGLILTEIARLNREALDAHYIMTAQQGEIERLLAVLKRIADDDVDADLRDNPSILRGIAWAALDANAKPSQDGPSRKTEGG